MINLLRLFKEIISIYDENHGKATNTNATSLTGKVVGTYS
jgi:hypothetical protein